MSRRIIKFPWEFPSDNSSAYGSFGMYVMYMIHGHNVSIHKRTYILAFSLYKHFLYHFMTFCILKTESRHDDGFSSLVLTQVFITTISGGDCDDNVGIILRTLNYAGYVCAVCTDKC